MNDWGKDVCDKNHKLRVVQIKKIMQLSSLNSIKVDQLLLFLMPRQGCTEKLIPENAYDNYRS